MFLPKSWLEFGVGRVALQQIGQKVGIEHVDAHARQRRVGLAQHGRRILRLLEERDDAVAVVDMHHAESGRLHPRHLDAADGHIGVLLDVLLQHLFVVHLVDVIAGQDDHVTRPIALDDIDILVHRVGGAEIPHPFRDALAGGKNVETLVAFVPEEGPAVLHVADQTVGLVLGRHGDATDT